MEFLKLDPDIDSDPAIMRAGWAGARFYELLLKVSAKKDLKGRVPLEYQDFDWLVRVWNLRPEDLGEAIQIATFIASASDAAIRAGLVTVDGTDWVLRGWEKYYRPAKSGAERMRGHRSRRDESDERHSPNVTRDAGDESDATSPTIPTPLHPPTPPTSQLLKAPPVPVAPTVVPPDATRQPEDWSEVEFWAWAQSIRELGGYFAEDPPKQVRLERWFSEALRTQGVTVPVLKEAFYAFGRSEHWGGAETPYPFNAFIAEWKKFLPPRRARAAS